MNKSRKLHHAGRILSLLLVFCMTMAFLPLTAFAENGPSTGEYSCAWVKICTEQENGEIYGCTIWSRDGEEIDTVQGASYSEATNTLTLTDVNMPDYYLLTNEMGDDFKVELVGDNHLLFLYTYGFGWGGSVELTGNGSLTLNEKKTAKCTPVTLCAEYTDAAFVVDSTVTLTVYKTSGNPYIVENTMTSRSENAIRFNGKTGDVGITTKEIQKDKTLPVFYTVSEYPCTFYEYYTRDDDDETYVINEFHILDENYEETGEVFWSVYGMIEVDHPTVTTGKILVELETLYDDPATQGYIKHDGEISANDLGNGSSSITIVKNTSTGKEYAYVINWTENTYTLYELVAELEGFDAGWGSGNIWYAAPAEPEVTGSVDDELPAGYEYITVGGTGLFNHTATGGSGDVFTQTPLANDEQLGGDINGDRTVDAADLLAVQQLLLGQTAVDSITPADLDKDGKITSADLVIMQFMLLGL